MINCIHSLRSLFKLFLAASTLLILYSCASIGTPSGGPRDEDPPRFIKGSPAPGATNVSKPTINLEFNELVNVKDAFSNVIVSPPSRQAPRITSNGRHITISFPDTLLPNTTYTIDFGKSIEDVNENNPLEGFSYSFSTGESLDSLRISGMVLDASNLEPQKDVIVGVHSILADSAFIKLPFERIAKTDELGRFIIRGLKPGPYRIFALNDMNNDFIWDNPEESIAFYDEIVTPQVEFALTTDTIYDLRTSKIDTIIDRQRTIFLPNDILLPLFNINFKQQYPVSKERPDSARIQLIFNAHSPSTPSLTVLDRTAQEDWYDLERSINNDSLTFWLRDPHLIKADTLRFRLDYDKVLRSGDIQHASDTLTLVKPVVKTPKNDKKRNKKQEQDSLNSPEISFLSLNFASSPSLDVFAPVILESAQPLESFFSDAIHLEKKVDSLWTRLPDFNGVSLADSLQIRKYKIEYPWEYGAEYRVRVDSLAATSIYGLFNRPMEQTFSIKKESDYSALNISIIGLPDSIPAFVELLNASDSPVRSETVSDGKASFSNLNPGVFYARLILDFNNNGRFDTGNYDRLLQPEIVFYYPKKINLKKNWTIDQTWNIYDTPVNLQKPEAIKKNKPQNRRNSGLQPEEEEEDVDDGYFDPTVNPFDPKSVNRSKNRRNNTTSY